MEPIGTLCGGCKSLDLGGIYPYARANYRRCLHAGDGPKKWLFEVDTSTHAGFQSAMALKKSARTCCCCGFIVQALSEDYDVWQDRWNSDETLHCQMVGGKMLECYFYFTTPENKRLLGHQDATANSHQVTEYSGQGLLKFDSYPRSSNYYWTYRYGFPTPSDASFRVTMLNSALSRLPRLLPTVHLRDDLKPIERWHEPHLQTEASDIEEIGGDKSKRPDQEVPLNPISPPAMATVWNWMNECKSHTECNRQPLRDWLPSRLLDVGAGTGSRVRLHESHASKLPFKPYLALSHCWGLPYDSRLTSRNLQEYLERIPQLALPQTYRDAILLTQELGFRYLWIDSLCIIQDDRVDWETQSAEMALLFREAYLVIAASTAKSDGVGFLGDRLPVHAKCGSFVYGGTEIDAHLFRPTLDARSLSHLLKKEPLSSRGWAVQERLLARRQLIYASTQMFWSCSTCDAAEDGSKADHGRHNSAASEKDTYTEWSEERDKWWKHVVEYVSCKLTHREDKLPAIAGVADEYARTNNLPNKEYLAGHWLKGIPGSLMCYAKDGPLDRKASMYLAPSWSWVSYGGEVDLHGFFYMLQSSGDTLEYLAEVSSYHIVPSGMNPFGQVSGGWLRLLAPVVPVTAVLDSSLLYTSFRCAALDTTLIADMSVSGATERGCFALCIANFDGLDMRGDTWSCQGLIIVPSESTPGAYERVGSFSMILDAGGRVKDLPSTQIILV